MYLLTWHPARGWSEFPEDLKEFQQTGHLCRPWSCGTSRRIVAGDRLFLMRLGVEPKGIVASAVALNSPYEASHWEEDRSERGQKGWFVDADFDHVSAAPVVSLAELTTAPFDAMSWTPQAAGIRIPAEVVSPLLSMWARRTGVHMSGGRTDIRSERPGSYSTADYARALSTVSPRITAQQRAMLRAHALAPRGVMTVTQLAAAAGYNRPNITYSQYGRLGTLLSKALGHKPERVRTRIIGDDFRLGDESVAWRMEPALARAVEAAGWTGASEGLERDVETILSDPGIAETERIALVQSRVGQGAFRDALLRAWGSCAVTGVMEPAALRASHIKPWHASNNVERLDVYNGLLLAAHLDALFDAGLISFADSGAILLARQLHPSDRARLGLAPGMSLRRVPPASRSYLAYHRRRHGFEDGA